MDGLDKEIIEILRNYTTLEFLHRQRIGELKQEKTYLENANTSVYTDINQQQEQYIEILEQEIKETQYEYQRIQTIRHGFLRLPQDQKEILEELYIRRKPYKELTCLGLSKTTIERKRKKGLEAIKRYYQSKEDKSEN